VYVIGVEGFRWVVGIVRPVYLGFVVVCYYGLYGGD